MFGLFLRRQGRLLALRALLSCHFLCLLDRLHILILSGSHLEISNYFDFGSSLRGFLILDFRSLLEC